jgi:lipoprotein-anchoring transpeptidase ErfK/SrfK
MRHSLPCTIIAAALLMFHEAPARETSVDEKALKLQVWLDRQNFGPGKIDAKGGEFTSKALALYKSAHPEAQIEKEAPAEFQDPAIVEYTIREEDFKHVGELPSEREAQAKLKTLPYPSIAALIAERFHTDEKFLRTLNPDPGPEKWKAGDAVKVPNVEPFEIERLKESDSDKDKEKPTTDTQSRAVQIDTQERMLTLTERDKVIAAFPVTCGSERLPAPPGEWKVESITKLPPFRWDLEMLNEGKRGKDAVHLPPGPRNPVGVMWMALNKEGIGIHGTDRPATIGRSESHGCIRLSNWDAVKVSEMIKKGSPVTIK